MSSHESADPDWVAMFSASAPVDGWPVDQRREDGSSADAAVPEAATDDGIADHSPAGWLDHAWTELPQRSRNILRRRIDGETLDDIGLDLNLTRERVRQLQKKAETALVGAMAHEAPQLQSELHTELDDSPAVSHQQIASLLDARTAAAASCLLKTLGISHPNTWAGPLTEYWTFRPDALQQKLEAWSNSHP